MTALRTFLAPLRIPRRGWLVFAHDVIMAAASFVLAMLLRVGDQVIPYFFTPRTLIEATLLFTGIAAAVFILTGLYRGVWRYASAADLVAVGRAATITVLAFIVVMFLWTRLQPLPRSVPFINWLVLMALLGGPRFVYRLFRDRRLERRREAQAGRKVPVLLVGAGAEAELFIRGLRDEPQRIYHVVGILAETPKRVGQHIRGVPVLGTIDALPEVVETLKGRDLRPQRLILTKESMDGAKVRRLFDRGAELGMTLARMPRLTEFKSGLADPAAVRPVAVEDLLGRPQTPLDREGVRALVAGRRVVVTGAGGSIGSELARQVGELAPAELVLIDNGEHNLYTIDMEMRQRGRGMTCRPILADVRDRPRIGAVFDAVRPQVVFHAAALKHVPLVEANPREGLLTNVFGTVNVADSCVDAGVAIMVLISTDKAIRPASIMGAGKRIAERYCQAMDMQTAISRGTRFVTVRFGNVLGSTGSVVPLFQKQLAAGGPLTVTHPDMTRYFMTVREAVELVLAASALGSRSGAGDGRIFVLDMGEPVRILDLANQMIRLAGLRPGVDIKIEFVGARPGEKLFEQLFHDDEDLVPTECPGLMLAAPEDVDLASLQPDLDALAAACRADDEAEMRRRVHRLVPEFRRADPALPRLASA